MTQYYNRVFKNTVGILHYMIYNTPEYSVESSSRTLCRPLVYGVPVPLSWGGPACGHGGPPWFLYQHDRVLQGKILKLDLLDVDEHQGPCPVVAYVLWLPGWVCLLSKLGTEWTPRSSSHLPGKIGMFYFLFSKSFYWFSWKLPSTNHCMLLLDT